MLLSRVAESVYWAGRYLERAEATARLVHVHTELFLDLPKAAGVGWTPLLAVTGSGQAFRHRHTGASEEEVVDFLAISAEHQGSILASVAQAHANLRVTQAVLPSEAWGVLNQLHSWVAQTRHEAVDRVPAYRGRPVDPPMPAVLGVARRHHEPRRHVRLPPDRPWPGAGGHDDPGPRRPGWYPRRPERRRQPVRRLDVDGGPALARRPPDVPAHRRAYGVRPVALRFL